MMNDNLQDEFDEHPSLEEQFILAWTATTLLPDSFSSDPSVLTPTMPIRSKATHRERRAPVYLPFPTTNQSPVCKLFVKVQILCNSAPHAVVACDETALGGVSFQLNRPKPIKLNGSSTRTPGSGAPLTGATLMSSKAQ